MQSKRRKRAAKAFENIFNGLRNSGIRVFRDPSDKYRMNVDMTNICPSARTVGTLSYIDDDDKIYFTFGTALEVVEMNEESTKKAILINTPEGDQSVMFAVKFPFTGEDGAAGLVSQTYSFVVDASSDQAIEKFTASFWKFKVASEYFCKGNKNVIDENTMKLLDIIIENKIINGRKIMSVMVDAGKDVIKAGNVAAVRFDFGEADEADIETAESEYEFEGVDPEELALAYELSQKAVNAVKSKQNDKTDVGIDGLDLK